MKNLGICFTLNTKQATSVDDFKKITDNTGFSAIARRYTM